jgi:hypothetical protein
VYFTFNLIIYIHNVDVIQFTNMYKLPTFCFCKARELQTKFVPVSILWSSMSRSKSNMAVAEMALLT